MMRSILHWIATSSLAVQAAALAMSFSASTDTPTPKALLFDMPVSNNGARCRIIVYKKALPETEVRITKVTEAFTGLKSDEYLKVNPQGKMPALSCSDLPMGNLAESDTIARYLISKYCTIGPSFQPDNPRSNLICRMHDMYLTSIQGCMYKATGPFGIFGTRKDAIAEYSRQLQVIEDLIDPDGGMYLCGEHISLADATLFPSCVFASHILPKFDVDAPLPPKMTQWFNDLRDHDSAFSRIYDEMMESMQAWEARGRWDAILGAGWRDNEPPTLFDKIVSGEIHATIVKETDKVLAFKDINPAAPAHVLVIPKHRNGLTRFSKATDEHEEILGKLMVVAAEVSRDKDIGFGDGARIVINDGSDGGQEINHVHVHVLGGRAMEWPPG